MQRTLAERGYRAATVEYRRGRVSIEGSIKSGPPGIQATFSAQVRARTKIDTAETIVRSFIDDLRDVLGLCEQEELRPRDADASTLGVAVDFDRFVGGLPLENGRITANVSPTGELVYLAVDDTRCTAELAKAASEAHKTADEIATWLENQYEGNDNRGIKIARLRNGGKLARLRKVATVAPPYVIWEAVAPDYTYRINAFTGEVISKTRATVFD